MALERLKHIMNEKGVSQSEIAAVIGRDKSAASLLFQGKRQLKVDEAKKIAKFLGVPIAHIFEEKVPVETINVSIPVLEHFPEQKISDSYSVAVVEFIPYPSSIKTIFAVKLLTNEADVIAPQNSLVIIDYSKTDPQELIGKLILAYVEDIGCVLRVYKHSEKEPERLEAVSNARYETIFLSDRKWECLGKVVGVLNKLEE